MARAYIALGANLGDRAATLNVALTALNGSRGIRVLETSSFHETAPVGGPPGQPSYLNAVAAVETDLDPAALLQFLLAIEQRHGRVRGEKDAPRTLDLDLLMYDNLVRLDVDPILPHPRMHQREFVLAPMAEVASEAIHPPSGSRIRELLRQARGHAPSPFRLDGVRALVTGATGGIGRATALALAVQGADVLVHGRRSDAASEVVSQIRQLSRRGESLLVELAHTDACSELAENAWAIWSGIDVWVNVAGADVLTGTPKDWSFEQKLAGLWLVDVRATVSLSRAIGERMAARGRGCIINIGWDQAETGMDGDSGQLFASAKAAVIGFTKSLAKTLAPTVRVNCVAPGWIKTKWGEAASPTWHDRVKRETPLQRWGTPNDVAGAICWLASPAAAFVTGQVIRVNGGAVML